MLDILELDGLLIPVQGLVATVLGILPNVAAAVVLGVVGWVVAKILGSLVGSLLAAAGIDSVSRRLGMKAEIAVSSVIGTIVFIFVFVPALVAALEALRIEAIARPASEMLGTFLQAIPLWFATGLILVAAFLIGRFISEVACRVLRGIGFDRVPQTLGLPALLPRPTSLSALAGRLILIAVMLFAGIEAAQMPGFDRTSQLATMFLEFGGQVLLGVAILGLGVWLANLTYEAVTRVSRLPVLADAVRVVLIALVLAMGLNAMGVAKEIMILAFGLPLGAVALAVAISFGIGGREVAARRLERWMSQLEERPAGDQR